MKVRVSFSNNIDTIIADVSDSCLDVLCERISNTYAFVCLGDRILNTSLITDIQLLKNFEG